MTDAPKLLTEAEWLERIASWGVGEGAHLALADLRERGLIADEPVDPLLIEAREICSAAYRAASFSAYADEMTRGILDDIPAMQSALTALRRGREIEREAASPLTHRMVVRAVQENVHCEGNYRISYVGIYDALHAALTAGQP